MLTEGKLKGGNGSVKETTNRKRPSSPPPAPKRNKEKTITLFSYGSVILPSMTEEVFKTSFTPLKSVFIRGYQLVLKHANSKEYGWLLI